MHSEIKHSEIKVVDRSGYVLLTVLAVLVLMVTVLATLSKLSLRRALAAADAQVRLQQRLGADSIEKTLLPQAGKIFDTLEKQAEDLRISTGKVVPIPRTLRKAVSMGGVTFDVVLADEDAKLNLNQVYHINGPQRCRRAISELVGPNASRAIRMLPATRPMRDALLESAPGGDSVEASDEESDAGSDASDLEIPRAFRCWGEVFDLDQLSAGFLADAAIPNLTSEITCWGGGNLNVRRASDRSMKAAIACVLSDAGAGRLVSRYRENPDVSLEIVLQQETNTATERLGLGKMLSETSSHFSLWIDASAGGRRSARTFSVMQRTDDGIVFNERFAF